MTNDQTILRGIDMLGSKHRSKGPHEWLAEYHLADCPLAEICHFVICHFVI